MKNKYDRFLKSDAKENNSEQEKTVNSVLPNVTFEKKDNDNLTINQLNDIQNILEEKIRKEISDQEIKNNEKINRLITAFFDRYKQETDIFINTSNENLIKTKVFNEITGFGPLEELLNDDDITEIMVNKPHEIHIEKNGELFLSNVKFKNYDHAKRILDKIVNSIGRKIDEQNPTVDARLPQGFRLNAVIPPIAIHGGIHITIRKFPKKTWQKADLIEKGAASADLFDFLELCVKAKINLCVSGGTGSGKTTLLNVLSNCIPENERIATIEDCAELRLVCNHLISHETRPPNSEGKNEVSIRDLIANALRQRPTRIIVGEVRKSEAIDMLQAMSTGHDGSMTTGHATTPEEFLGRLEYMCLMSNMPIEAIKRAILFSIKLIVQIGRVRVNGKYERKILSVVELLPEFDSKGDYQLKYIFNSNYKGSDKYELEPTGYIPTFGDVLECDFGFDLSKFNKPKTHIKPI